jgi:hypothetical protein
MCKDASAYAVIRMKRTFVFLHVCLQGWYRDYKPRPFPGMGFFCFLAHSIDFHNDLNLRRKCNARKIKRIAAGSYSKN